MTENSQGCRSYESMINSTILIAENYNLTPPREDDSVALSHIPWSLFDTYHT
jgi:hypothetical protein